MIYPIDLQIACDDLLPVSEAQLIEWAQAALIEQKLPESELTLRLVSLEEITQLNHQFRQKNQATNVLAFPSNIPKTVELEFPLLGDVIICPAVLNTESVQQNKSSKAHWAHIIIHGVLHLLGYKHEMDADTKYMQAIEVKLLTNLGFSNPYRGQLY